MPRERFPFHDGRDLIERWIKNTPGDNATDFLEVMGKTLKLKDANDTTVAICWIAQSDDALYARIPRDINKFYAMLTINVVLELLDVPERVARETGEGNSTGKLFLGDQIIAEEEPILLAGPLTVMAFRAPVALALVCGAATALQSPPPEVVYESEPEFENHYRCDECDIEWQDTWSCACNDKCPQCNHEIEPYRSEEK